MGEAPKLEPPLQHHSDLTPVHQMAEAPSLQPYETLINVLVWLLFAMICFSIGAMVAYGMFQGYLDGLTPAVKSLMNGLDLQ